MSKYIKKFYTLSISRSISIGILIMEDREIPVPGNQWIYRLGLLSIAGRDHEAERVRDLNKGPLYSLRNNRVIILE